MRSKKLNRIYAGIGIIAFMTVVNLLAAFIEDDK
jgi:hypothetical protein